MSNFLQQAIQYLRMVPLELILTLVAALIAVYQWQKQRSGIRKQNFEQIVRSVRNERAAYAKECLQYYHKRYDGDRDVLVDQILYRRDWVQAPEDPRFLPLSQVRLILDSDPEKLWDSSKNPRPEFLPNRRECYAENARVYCEMNLTNRPLYGLAGVEVATDGTQKSVTLRIARGRYFDFYDTCAVLSAELAYYRRIRKKPHLSACRLPLREGRKDVFDFTNRFAGIGVNTLTILQNVQENDGFHRNYFLLHHRSETGVAEGANAYHVVPAGSYQPASEEFQTTTEQEDFDLSNTVKREFAEELLGQEEFATLVNAKLTGALRDLPPVWFLGVGLDPVNLKAEVLACLMLDVEQTSLLGGSRTRTELDAYLTESYEGSVQLKPLTMDLVKQYRDNPNSIPAFRQIFKVVSEHADYFGVDR